MNSRSRFARRREQVIIWTEDDPVAEFTLMTFKGIKECFDGHQLSRMNLCQCEVFLFSELLIGNCEALDMLLTTMIYIMSTLTTLGADVFVLLHLLCNCRQIVVTQAAIPTIPSMINCVKFVDFPHQAEKKKHAQIVTAVNVFMSLQIGRIDLHRLPQTSVLLKYLRLW